jgi:hypothetical protein
MGWTAYYQVRRTRALTKAEIRGVAELVRTQRNLPWEGEQIRLYVARGRRADHIIAAGSNKLAGDDVDRLDKALESLHDLLGGELLVADDLGGLGSLDELIDVDEDELADVRTLAPETVHAIDGADVDVVVNALAAADSRAAQDSLIDQLAGVDPMAVALTIYKRYKTLGHRPHVQQALPRAGTTR